MIHRFLQDQTSKDKRNSIWKECGNIQEFPSRILLYYLVITNISGRINKRRLWWKIAIGEYARQINCFYSGLEVWKEEFVKEQPSVRPDVSMFWRKKED